MHLFMHNTCMDERGHIFDPAVVSTHSAGVVPAHSSSMHYWPRIDPTEAGRNLLSDDDCARRADANKQLAAT